MTVTDGMPGAPSERVSVDLIKAAVARHYRMSVPELLRKTREKAVSHPRQVAMYLATRLTPHSLPCLGRLFGGYDHTTVLYAKRKVQKLCAARGACGDKEQTWRHVESLLDALGVKPTATTH